MDIALQHISDNMLQRMHRHVTRQETYALIERFREEVPGIHLRTTLMVGHPGETEEDFNELLDFVRKVKFDRMGAFAYSEEEGTYSAEHYEDEIPFETKQARLDKLMALQQKISADLAAQKIGKIFKVIIDRSEGEYYIGRTEFDSPEVDPEVLIPVSEGTLSLGAFYEVKITDADDFDLYGTQNVLKSCIRMNNKEFIAELSLSFRLYGEGCVFIDGCLGGRNDGRMEDENVIAIQNIGSFEVRKKQERVVVNPATQQRMLVPPKLVINFKPSASFKEKMQ